MTKTIPIPSGINAMKDGRRLRDAKQATMLTRLGNPRADLTAECQSVANPALKAMMVTASVGPFRVTGLRIAVESLLAVITDIGLQRPDIHDALSSAVMQFQAMNGLTVDGVVGRDTWTELLKVRKAKGLPIAEDVETAASAARRVATPR